LGIITTIAGNGSPSFGGDGGLATLASLYHPYGVAVDAIGNIYIADEGNERIRKIDTLELLQLSQEMEEPQVIVVQANLPPQHGCPILAVLQLMLQAIFILQMREWNYSESNMSTDSIWVVAGNGISMSGGDGGLLLMQDCLHLMMWP